MYLIFILFFAVSSWANCVSLPSGEFVGRDPSNGSGTFYCNYGSDCSENSGTMCSSGRYCQNDCALGVVQLGSYFYTDIRNKGKSSSACTNSESGCYSSSVRNYAECFAYQRCDSDCEAKKANCQLQGGIWIDSTGYGECDGYCEDPTCQAEKQRCEQMGGSWTSTPDDSLNCGICDTVACDTSKWECIDYAPREHCVDVPSSGQIVCTSNGCSGLPYSKWWSEHRRDCTNECGGQKTETESTDTLVTFDATCDDSTRCSDETYCVDVGGKYIVYQKCQVGNSQVGNNQSNRTLAEIVESGSGSCAQHNYNSNNVSNPNSNNQNSPNDNNQNPIQDSVSNDCLVYGVNCPEKWTDTTDYSLDDNKSPDNGCICEGGAGLRYITCPDGSITAEFGNCSDWRKSFSSSSFSSSSNPPEPTSSGSENPQSSSGGVSDMASMFERNFAEMKKALLGIAENTKETSNGVNQQNSASASKTGTATIENAMDSYTTTVNDSTPEMRVPDSMLVARDSLDTSFVHHIFDKVSEKNTILDTVPNVGYSGCPCVTFFQGNVTNHIENGVWRFKEIKIDFSSVYGINLCTVISTIVVALASVVSFFIGFAIFKNVSQ